MGGRSRRSGARGHLLLERPLRLRAGEGGGTTTGAMAKKRKHGDRLVTAPAMRVLGGARRLQGVYCCVGVAAIVHRVRPSFRLRKLVPDGALPRGVPRLC